MVPWYMYEIVVPFGNPNFDVGLGGSHDMDIGCPPNYPVTVLPGCSGTISDISAPSWGKQVCLKLDSPINGVPYMAYLHLAAPDPSLSIGKHLNAGDRIGWTGGGNTAAQYLGTSNPTGSNFINSPDMSSRIQQGVALMRGPVYGGAGWETFPPVDWALDPTPTIQAAQKAYAMKAPPAVNAFGRVGLFFGVDTFSWTDTQWDAAAQFCADHHVNFAVIKVFEVTQGEWYGGNFSPIMQKFESRGVAVLPYGFLYGGSDLTWEIGMLEKYMSTYGVVCADLEGGPWWNQPGQGQAIADALSGKPGLFFASIPADPSASTFQPMASRMLAMPMSYSDSLVANTKADMAAIGQMPVYPTLDLSTEFGPNNYVKNAQWAAQYDQVSFWYYGFAKSNPALLDKLISIIGSVPGGGIMAGVPAGWSLSADGSTLTAKNGVPVKAGFKSHVMGLNWDPENVPMISERNVSQVLYHASFGAGAVQPFRDSFLWWTQQKGVVEERELGVEIYLRDLAISNFQAQLATTNAALDAANAQLAQCLAGQGGITPELQAVINNGEQALNEAIKQLTDLAETVQPYVK
jgi:hypothetical protein